MNNSNTILSRRSVVGLGASMLSLFIPSTAFAVNPITQMADLPCSRSISSTPYVFVGHSVEETESFISSVAQKESDCFIKECGFIDDSGIEKRGRPYYETEYGDTQNTSSGYRYITSDTYSFSHGGLLYFSPSGGPNISISFSFPAKFGGTIGVSVSFGKKVTGPSGVGVNIPGGQVPYKVQLNNTYASKPYTVYYIDAYGNRSVYAHMHTTPTLIGYDFRVVRA